MQKPISRRQHGLVDYTYVPAVAAAPDAFGFADVPAAARFARGLSAATLAATLLTRAEWGAVRAIPYRAHLALDVGAGLLTMAAPWLLGFADNARARNAFLVIGLTGVVVAGLLSEPEEMPAPAAERVLGRGTDAG